jgi:hypothetical protein
MRKPSFNSFIYTVLSFITAAICYFSWILVSPSTESGQFVSFDTHKFINAQRIKTNNLLGGNLQNTWKISAMNKQISNSVKQVIRDIAGNAVVISKSSVVLDDNIYDITNEVLITLNLPTDVPDINALILSSIESIDEKYLLESQSSKIEREPTAPILNEGFFEMLP